MSRNLLGVVVASALVGGLALVGDGCSNTVPGSGIELIIDSNLMASQFDAITLEVQQATASGGWTQALIDESFQVPGTAQLPATYAIQSGSSSNQVVLINVTAMKGSARVVQRQVQVQVPNDRLAELTVLLAESCVNRICDPLQNVSCQPATGTCSQTTTIMAQSLPSFNTEAGVAFYVDAGGSKRDSGTSGSGSGSGASGSASGSGSGPASGSGSSSDSGSGSGSHDGGSADVDGGDHLPDAGHDSGHDSGLDSGTGLDSGHDAGHDSGHDAGHDSGHDAGCTGGQRSCDGWCCPAETTCGGTNMCCMGTCFVVLDGGP